MNLDEQNLLDLYSRAPGVRLIMAANANVETVGPSGSSNDVSNPLDRELLVHLRRISDIVITDAATAAAEKYRPSNLVDIEVWSKTGNFRGLTASRGVRTKFTLETVPDIKERLKLLRASHESILIETGMSLSKQLAQANEIDAASLTITGATSETMATMSLERFQSVLSLEHLRVEGFSWINDTLFARLGT